MQNLSPPGSGASNRQITTDAVPYLNKTIADFAREHVASHPHRTALIADRAYSYVELLEEAEALASALQHLGILPGEVVSFQLPNWRETFVINLACVLGGFVVNPIIPIYRDREVTQILEDSSSKIFFGCEIFRGYDFAAMIERVVASAMPSLHTYLVRSKRENSYDALVDAGRNRPFTAAEVDPDAPKLVLFTSGTTGRAKGVLHSHNTLVRAAQNAMGHWDIRDADVMLMPSPVTHISGFSNGLELPLIAGTATVLMEHWDAEQGVRLIDDHAVVGTVAATPFLEELIQAAETIGSTLPTLRFFACGGAPVTPKTVISANAYLGRVCSFRIFGSSEVPFVTLGYTGPENGRLAATTDGQIVDYDVRVLDDSGAPVPDGVEGEIAAKGRSMFLRYLKAPENEIVYTSDGYFLTGDLGSRVNGDGLVISGRKKDLIVRGGENISAAEIENIIAQHPAITGVAVVAIPHDRLGEGVGACVTANANIALSDLVAFMSDTGLAKQKYPEKLLILDELPRTASGKIRKDLLRERLRREHTR